MKFNHLLKPISAWEIKSMLIKKYSNNFSMILKKKYKFLQGPSTKKLKDLLCTNLELAAWTPVAQAEDTTVLVGATQVAMGVDPMPNSTFPIIIQKNFRLRLWFNTVQTNH